MSRNHRITISLTSETLTLVSKCFEKIQGGYASQATRIAYVLDALLNQWDTIEEMFVDRNDPEVSLSGDIEEQLRTITQPDIGLEVKVRHDRTTPKATDGLIPWEYIAVGYSKLEAVAATVSDYTDLGERRTAVIRAVLTRIPEDQWESEQTRSILAKALAQVV